MCVHQYTKHVIYVHRAVDPRAHLPRYYHTQVIVAASDGVLQERKVVEVSLTRPGGSGGGGGDNGGKGRKRAAFYRLQSTDAPSRKKVRGACMRVRHSELALGLQLGCVADD